MAYPATGNSGNVTTGPGWLYVAPLGTAEPTSSSAVLPSAWQEVGFTDAGSTFTTDITSEGIEVAETPDRIATVQTTRVTTIAFAMAETTRRNLLLALGSGVGVNNAAVIHLPDFTDLVDVMIVLQAVDGARWVFPSVSPRLGRGCPRTAPRKEPADDHTRRPNLHVSSPPTVRCDRRTDRGTGTRRRPARLAAGGDLLHRRHADRRRPGRLARRGHGPGAVP
jgi:hypothetical protein